MTGKPKPRKTKKTNDQVRPLDRAGIARRREERWLRRKAQIDADIKLDPRLSELFQDRTPWGVPDLMAFLDITNYRLITTMNQNRLVFRSANSYFPAVLPEMDFPLGEGDVRPRPGWEAGLLRQWAFDDNRVVWNVREGVLQVNPHWRSGRAKGIPSPNFKSLGEHRDTHTGREARRITRGTTRKKPDQDA